MSRDTPREMIDCRSCNDPFDLASQQYYDDLCPSCKREEDPEATWPTCAKCQERVPPDERTSVKIKSRSGTERLPAHEDCAEDHTPTPPW